MELAVLVSAIKSEVEDMFAKSMTLRLMPTVIAAWEKSFKQNDHCFSQ